jgi:signal transduction histidine kinase
MTTRTIFKALAMFIAAGSASSLLAKEAGWEQSLAGSFSRRLAQVEREIAATREELNLLPGIPVADQGGTGGFASLHPAERPPTADDYSVSIRFRGEAELDLIALVPARRYGVKGLDAQFGLPDAFTVELLDQEGRPLRKVASERDLWSDPVRSGHPFVYPLEQAVKAWGLRVSASRLRLDSDVSDSFVHAWAEIFAFSGETNLALGAEVKSADGTSPSAPWQWGGAFLVDGQTPLGLPELPAGSHANVGWMSEARPKASDTVWVELDLGEARDFDAIQLYPARRPTSDLPSGFGFPRRFTLTVSGAGRTVKEESFEMANPGHNPVLVSLGATRGRSVRIEATELWKSYASFPAFFALSEVEVLAGNQAVSHGAAVRSSGGMGAVVGSGVQYWIASSLSDGFGPEGKLVSRREWLLALDQRFRKESSIARMQQEADDIVAGFRRAGITTFGLLGAAGAFLLVYLPLRYRVRAKRELVKVRERIAGDLHDEVGSNLGSIQMLADLAEGHAGESGPTRELKRIQRIAAETVSAVRDIVWLLRPQGDHRIGTVEHLRETSSIMLEPLEWEFTANEAAWQCEMSDEMNRHLFLFFREALHNLLRHSGAKKALIRVECDAVQFLLTVADDGCGIPPEKLARPSTLRALRQRVEALGADFCVESEPDRGTRLKLGIPLAGQAARRRTAKRGIAAG